MNCPFADCGRPVADDAAFCLHCQRYFKRPRRPLGLTVVAVIVVVTALPGFGAAFTQRVPEFAAGLASWLLLHVLAGVGLYLQREIARKLVIVLLVLDTAAMFGGLLIMFGDMPPSMEPVTPRSMNLARVTMGLVTAIQLTLSIYIIRYLKKRREFFRKPEFDRRSRG